MRLLSSVLVALLLSSVTTSQTNPLLRQTAALSFAEKPETILVHKFLDDQNRLLLVGRKTSRVLDVASGRFLESQALETPELTEDRSRVISPDGRKLLVFGNYDSQQKKDKVKHAASIWDLRTGKQIAVLDKTTKRVRAGFWSNNGKTLVTSSDRNAPRYTFDTSVEIAFWDGETFELRNTLPAERINWWHLTADGSKCFYSTGPVKNLLFIVKYLGDTGGPVNVWDINTGKIERVITAGDGNTESNIRGRSVSADERFLAFVAQRPKSKDTERKLVIWEIDKSSSPQYRIETRHEIQASPKVFEHGGTFSHDAKYFAMRVGKNLHIYESKTGAKKFELASVKDNPTFWLNDNKILLYVSFTQMEALETETGKQLYEQPLEYAIASYTDSSDSVSSYVSDNTMIVVHPTRNLLLTHSDRYVKVFNSLTGELLQTVISPSMDYTKKKPRLITDSLVSDAGWSGDGKAVYIIGYDERSVSVWQMTEN